MAFKKTVFNNGLTLLSERHSYFRSLSIGVWVKVGTRHENPFEAGASHYLEHMLFKGTKRRTALQIAQEVDQVGGEFNAFTAKELTCFHIYLLNRDCNLGLDILIDVLMNSLFDSDELERERKVILQEISMVEESPEELAHDLFFEKIYGDHGLGKPILGTEASIRKMKREKLVDFFKGHYRPDQVVFSIAGDIDHDQIKRKLAPLGRKPWPGRNKVLTKATMIPPFESGFWWIKRPTEQVHLIWGVPGPRYQSSDRFAAFLLNVYLGGGMSSTLFQEIREKNALAYTVYSSLTPFVDSGVFSVYAATSVNQIPLCIKLIEECVDHVKNKLLSKKDLKIIQDNLKGTILLSSDNVESRMSSIAKNDIYLNRYYSVKEVCSMIDAVTVEDLRRVARQLFREDNRSVLALGPAPKKAMPGVKISS